VSETFEEQPRPTDPVGRVLYAICRLLSHLGGFVVFGMALLVTVSVTGRSTIGSPIYGDFEYITIFTGVAVFLFLPLCQLQRENVIVDFFMTNAPPRLKAACDAAGCLIYGIIIALMSWRTAVGGIASYKNHEETILLSWPLWSTFPLAVFCLIVLFAVCIYTLAVSVNQTVRGPRA
jgi:TRAP-type C4-dicarboxylate transport system permease small subunit